MRNGRKQDRASSIADFRVCRGHHSEARFHPPGRPASSSGRGVFGVRLPDAAVPDVVPIDRMARPPAMRRNLRRGGAYRIKEIESNYLVGAGAMTGSVFKRKLRYSTFIGGPTRTCTPIKPEAMRAIGSSSTTTLITCPFTRCVKTFPRMIRGTWFQSSFLTKAARASFSPTLPPMAKMETKRRPLFRFPDQGKNASSGKFCHQPTNLNLDSWRA